MKRSCGFVLAIFALCWQSANALASVWIVATVNGAPITSYELEQRALVLKESTNIEINEKTERLIKSDALQMLVDDKLKKGVALDKSLTPVSELTSKARNLVDEVYAEGDKSGIAVLRDLGIDPMTVQSTIMIDIVWSEYIQKKYVDKFAAIESKIDAEIDRIAKNASRPQIKLSEIVLLPTPNRDLKTTVNVANQIVNAIRKGASFSAVARQYSNAGSSEQGGKIGWVLVDRLPAPIIKEFENMANGEISNPIQLDGAVFIFWKESERKNGLADLSQTRVWLARAIVRLPEDANKADQLEAGAKIQRDIATVKNCMELENLNKRYGSQAVSRLDNMLLGDLAPEMQALVTQLKDNEPSAPIAFAEGVASMMVCRRDKPEISLPSRDQVRRIKIDQLFGDLSERHLLMLRRSAIIDMRD